MKKEELNTPSIVDLKQGLLAMLHAKSYTEGTLTNYRRTLTRLESYMYHNGIDTYTPIVGTAFITDYLSKHDLGISRQKTIATMVNRLSDYYNGTDYAIQRKQEPVLLPGSYEGLLNSYLSYSRKNGNKEGTIVAKRSFCRQFLMYLSDLGCHELSEWTSSYICKACVNVQNKDAWAVIRMFLKFLNLNDLVDADYSTLVPHYKKETIIPITYSENEVLRFENAIDRTTATGKRDYAMLLLATRLGMRSGDISKLSLDELDFEQDTIHLIQEKTSQPLDLPMLPEIKEALDDYIENVRPEVNENYVFLRLNAPYQRITTSVLRFETTRYFKEAGIDISGKKHGPHTFRSSLASSMVNDAIPYDVVRSILGHTDPDAVKHYAKLDIERLRECAIEVPEPSGIFKEFLDGGIQS
jgi:site-specific recombinase XerD